MSVNLHKLDSLLAELEPFNASLVAVSKTKPAEDIMLAYNHGQRLFGENYVQELVSKQIDLPKDVFWHFLGHLQTNKVKQITPFVSLIHGVDNLKLVKEISNQGLKSGKKIDILLQVHIATEETKFGFIDNEVIEILNDLQENEFEGVTIRGFMGMATFTENQIQIRKEFKSLRLLFDSVRSNMDITNRNQFNIVSMGMSNDYRIALEEGSTMVRIGSAIFGERNTEFDTK